MLSSRIGELAALSTAFSWTITGLAFESAGKKVGSTVLNFITLIFGFSFLSIFTYFTRGHLFPVDASVHNWVWLSLSGIIGFFIGDLFLFQSYIEIGTRISLLILASSPPITAILGFVFLKEEISIAGVLGMLITFLGISIVILSKDSGEKRFKFTHSIKGLIFAFLGAIGQSVGTILSKLGMNGYNAFAATQIRVLAGFISLVILFSYLNKWSDIKRAIGNKKAIATIALGSVFGSFLGVSLQLVSLQHVSAGITTTITSITPVIIIPFSIFVYKEKIKTKEILGAILSVSGVGVLFLI